MKSSEMIGEYHELAKRVRELMAGVAINIAARNTGVSHDTIRRTLRGDRPGKIMLDQMARGFRVHPNELRALAAYPLLEESGTDPSDAQSSDSPEMGEFVTLVTGDAIRLRRDNPNPQGTVDALNAVLRAIYQTQPPPDPAENREK